ncbi:arsenic metallochaperone ArsD family protein [Loigolactobacillus jiayinensis]|mgnify:CR=1 FL=1|uniref:Arsenic metallochaperone ArsD family protein n=1 Tax=Loigolactobacillus jiayinensis TaxID=2486016 RepID=A0ABW1RDS1_9LACO|nr:arsenic metallochaperone ArsD family protein [Loigolactobacillus jiayinensis]
MKKLELFEAAEYAADNPVLQMIHAAFTALEPVPFIEATRYNLVNDRELFAQRPEITALLQAETEKVLPITMFDGAVVKTGAYPSIDDLSTITDLDFVPADTGGGCCGGGAGECNCH